MFGIARSVSGLFFLGCCSAIFAFSFNAGADATFKIGALRFGDKEYKTLILQNEYYCLKIVPALGGRIVEWIDRKQGGGNVVSLPKERATPGYGGLLDDHGWTGNLYHHPFVYDVKSEGVNTVIVELRPRDRKLYKRTITIRSGSPLVEIEYTFSNYSQKDGHNILIRNVIWPSGEPRPKDHLYITPLTKGLLVNHRFVNTAQGRTPPSMAAPWRAFGSVSRKRIVAFAYGDDLFAGAYDWEGSSTRPTFEWYYKGIPKGKRVTSKMYAALLHGFEKIVYFSDKLAVDLNPARMNGVVKVAVRLSTFDPNMKKVTLKTRITDLNGGVVAKLPDLQLDGLKVAEPKTESLSWKSAKAAPVIIKQEAYQAGKLVARYEIPFELGNARYSRKRDFPNKAVYSDLPGWRYIPPLKVKVAREDERKGYVVFSGEGPDKMKSLKSVDLDLGVGEYESYELRFKTLSDIGGKVVVSAALPAGLRKSNVEISAVDRIMIAVIWGTKRYGWKFNKLNYFTPKKGGESRFWMIFNSVGVKPGKYTIPLTVKPERAPASVIALNITVWPVRMPADRHYYLEPNSTLNTFGWNAKKRNWDFTKAARYADDLAAHGTRMFRAYGSNNTPGAGDRWGGSTSFMKLRESGVLLKKALKNNPSIINQAKLPALDFSFWDKWIQMWIDRGFTRYSTYLGGMGSYFKKFAGFAKKYKAADPQKVRRWLFSESSRYLKERGFRHVYGVISDEIAPDLFKQWCEYAKDAKETGWSPGVTISNTFFKHEKIYRTAGPVMDYWAIGNPDAKYIEQAREDGYITAADAVVSYDGWGTRFREYSHMRASLWRRAFNDTDVFWIQCYIRNHSESIVFNENGIPYSSASWEGVRDGCEDGNYIKAAQGMIKILEKGGKQSLAAKFAKRLNAIIAGLDKDDNASLRTAKTNLFTLLLEMRKTLPPTKPSLLWEDLPIVADGTAMFALADSGTGVAADFAKLVVEKTGVEMRVIPSTVRKSEPNLKNIIVFGHPDDNPILRELIDDGRDLGVTKFYPAPDSYLIKELDYEGGHIIAIIGKGEGLKLGMNNFHRFLKLNFEYPNQYFP